MLHFEEILWWREGRESIFVGYRREDVLRRKRGGITISKIINKILL